MQSSQRRVGLWAVALVMVLTFSVSVSAVQLTIWHNWSPPRDVILTEVLQAFKDKNPGIEVEHYYYNTLETREKFLLSAGTDAAPDIIMLHELDFHAFVDLLVPLDTFLARDGIDSSMWYPTEFGAGLVGGIRYGLPMRTGGDTTSLFYINQDHFNEVGLDGSRAPDTWAEMAEALPRLNVYGPDGMLTRTSMNFRWAGDFSPFAWVYNGGGQIYDETGRNMRLTSGETVDAISTLADMIASSFRSPGDWSIDLTVQDFAAGLHSMMIGGSFLYGQVKAGNPDLNFTMALRPRREGVDNRGMYGWSFVYGIHKGTPHLEEAWKLMKFLTVEKDGVGEFMLRQGRPSPIREHNSDPRYFESNPSFHLIGEALGSVVAMPTLPVTREISDLFEEEFLAIIRGEKPLGPTLEEVQRLTQGVLDRYAEEGR